MVLGRLKSFDLYPKLSDDVRVKTFSGAAVSLIAAGAIVLLVISELLIYLAPVRADRLLVDASRGEQLPIFVDVTFPRIPCQLLSLQSMDVAGSDQIMLTNEFTKEPLDMEGKRIGPSTNYTLGRDIVLFGSSPTPSASPAAAAIGACGSCYGAERNSGDCCQTCADVRQRHEEKGLSKGSNDAEWEQCIVEDASRLSQDLANKHGCRIHGTVRVTKVAGNIFLVPGRPARAASLMNAASIDAHSLDVKHTVHSLQFGRVYPGIANPLDGVTKPDESSTSNRRLPHMYMYYVKVIPTVFTAGGEVVHTNQYSVTEHAKPLVIGKDATQHKQGPGAYFFYELSPIMVRTTETRPPILHFVTQLCAIVGGVFTVAGMVDRFIYAGMVHARGNVQLGTKVN